MTNREEIQRDLLLNALNCGGSDLNKLLEIIEKGVNKKFTLSGEEVYLLPHNWSEDVYEWAQKSLGSQNIDALIMVTFTEIAGNIAGNTAYNVDECFDDNEIDAMCSAMHFDKEKFFGNNGAVECSSYSEEEIETGLKDENEKILRIADEIETIINEF